MALWQFNKKKYDRNPQTHRLPRTQVKFWAVHVLVTGPLGGILGAEGVDALVLVDDRGNAVRHYLLALDDASLLATLAAGLRALPPLGLDPLRWTRIATTGLGIRGLQHRVAKLLVYLLVRASLHAAYFARLRS